MALHHEIDEQYGENGDGGSGHLHSVIDAAVEVFHGGDAELDRFHGVFVCKDEGIEVGVPLEKKAEDSEGGEDGPGGGEHDSPVDLEVSGAVDTGGIEHVVGDAFHVLTDQENAEGTDEAGDDEGEVGVIEAELGEDEEAGDEGYGIGNH